jgi:urease beta subunit
VIPGEWILGEDPIEINTGRRTLRLSVRNTGDRPIQVGSHFHFFEVNRALDFDRPAAVGMRLDVPSGQSIRFEAGDERDVDLVAFGGHGRVIGFNSLLDGATSSRDAVARAMGRVAGDRR